MSYEHVAATYKSLSRQTFQYWSEHCLFSWQWWFLLICVLVPWLVWWKLVRKARLLDITCYGALIALICVVLDCAGISLSLWGYPEYLIPFLAPPIFPVDLCILPVEHMLVYQYFPNWKGFFWMLAIAGLLNSFVAEPFFVWAGIYKMYMWQYIYSLPIYIIKGFVAKYCVQLIMNYQSQAASNR